MSELKPTTKQERSTMRTFAKDDLWTQRLIADIDRKDALLRRCWNHGMFNGHENHCDLLTGTGDECDCGMSELRDDARKELEDQ